ncbi:permease-like cell division protein FtsX [Micromonospora sp. MED01]|uniref:permease-like cell division protein FtsX n=1 Tax=Micromonospora alfalfae TaxID=2911212 RepID=UPI001EE81E4C|nr:permease-like cell division protein FtsX [Micromonospora alfalfae]MCG5464795.1 permease-like cell division protein FtsX [Micromonospora alfalfae]
MDQNLRVLFDRAVADEPALPLVDLVGDAVAAGTGLRRRRQRLVATGVAAVIAVAAVGAVNVATPPQRSAPPPTVSAAFGMLVNRACHAPADETATDAAVYLAPEITAQQRGVINRALDADPAVGTVAYESREQALEKFKKLYADAPELVDNIVSSQLPESFRITLVVRSRYAELAERVKRLDGVDEIIGIDCPAGTSASAVD